MDEELEKLYGVGRGGNKKGPKKPIVQESDEDSDDLPKKKPAKGAKVAKQQP